MHVVLCCLLAGGVPVGLDDDEDLPELGSEPASGSADAPERPELLLAGSLGLLTVQLAAVAVVVPVALGAAVVGLGAGLRERAPAELMLAFSVVGIAVPVVCLMAAATSATRVYVLLTPAMHSDEEPSASGIPERTIDPSDDTLLAPIWLHPVIVPPQVAITSSGRCAEPPQTRRRPTAPTAPLQTPVT